MIEIKVNAEADKYNDWKNQRNPGNVCYIRLV